MNYTALELSYSELNKQCLAWCGEMEEYAPQLVLFIAKAGYPIGKVIADHFGTPLLGVSAEREGGRLKKLVSPLFRVTPNAVRNYLIGKELSSGFHAKYTERHITFECDLAPYREKGLRVLLVDDSVDTGISLLRVKEAAEKMLGYTVRTAALNVWDKSAEVIRVDHALYRNTIIKAPMSKDSREYPRFLEEYEKYLAGAEKTHAKGVTG